MTERTQAGAHDEGPLIPGSFYLDAATVERALDLAAPMIESALADRSIVGSGFLCLVVLDPTRTAGVASFEQAIVAERAFGDRARWDADYAALARAKARLSWRSGSDGRLLHALSPHRLQRGDSLLSGGICLDGIVVAASGAFAAYDEVFAMTVALWLRALARDAREREVGKLTLGA